MPHAMLMPLGSNPQGFVPVSFRVLLSGCVAVVYEPDTPSEEASAGGAGSTQQQRATALAVLGGWNALGASPTAGFGERCAWIERCAERAELATMDATCFLEAMREDTRLLLSHQLTFLRSVPLFQGD